MKQSVNTITGFLVVASASWFPVRVQANARADLYGDPLPDGAVARLGTVRLRGGGWLSYATDGKSLISASRRTITFWDPVTGNNLRRVRLPADAQAVRVSDDGQRCAVFDARRKVVIVCDSLTGVSLRQWQLHSRAVIWHMAFSPDRKLLAAALRGYSPTDFRPKERRAEFHPAEVRIWETATGRQLAVLQDYTRDISGMAFSRDGRLLATCDEGGALRLLDMATWKPRRSWTTGQRHASITFVPRKAIVVTSGYQGAKVWDLNTGKLIHEFPELGRNSGLAVSHDGRLIALRTGEYTGHIAIVELESAKLIATINRHWNEGHNLVFSPDGKTLASGVSAAIRLWNPATGKLRRDFPAHFSRPDGVFSPDGTRVVSFGRHGDGTVRIWDAMTGRHQLTYEGHLQGALRYAPDTCGASFSRDGRLIASISSNQGIRLWDVTTGKDVEGFEALGDPEQRQFYSVEFSPDGKLLAAVGGDGHAHIWSTSTWKLTRRLEKNHSKEQNYGKSLTFSPDGRLLAVASRGSVVLWDTVTWKRTRQLRIGPGPRSQDHFVRLQFSPDGRFLLTSGFDGATRFWSIKTGRATQFLEKLRFTRLESLRPTLSPDGRTMLCRFPGESIRLVEVASEKTILMFKHASPPYRFSPDGTRALTGSDSTNLLIWDLGKLALRHEPLSRSVEREYLASLWNDLRGLDGPRAYSAMQRLVRAGDATVSYLSRKLPVRQTKKPEKRRIRELIRQLDDTDTEKRLAARRELTRIGAEAVPLLEEALAHQPTGPSYAELVILLSPLETPVIQSHEDVVDLVATIRALAVLEQIGTPEAVKQIERLSEAGPIRQVLDAKATLVRLRSRHQSGER